MFISTLLFFKNEHLNKYLFKNIFITFNFNIKFYFKIRRMHPKNLKQIIKFEYENILLSFFVILSNSYYNQII